MSQGEMKKQWVKKNKWTGEAEKASGRCVFSHFPGLYSFHYLCPLFCRLQCLCGRSSLESLWTLNCVCVDEGCRLGKKPQNTQMFSSELLFRAKRRNLSGCPINCWRLDWNGITSPDWAAHWLSFHFLTKICHSNPKIPAAGKQQGDCFLIPLFSLILQASLCFLSSLVTNFSRVWVSLVSPYSCLKCLESSSDRQHKRETGIDENIIFSGAVWMLNVMLLPVWKKL